MKDKVRNGKAKSWGQIKGSGWKESKERWESRSLCRWPHHHPNVLVIAAIHYRICDCLVQDQVPHPSLSASGMSMTKP